MQTPYLQVNLNEAPPYAVPQKINRNYLTLPFVILLLCMIPDIPGLAIAKIPLAIFLLILTLPAVLAGFDQRIRIVGRGVFMVFLLITVFNIFICLAYEGPILRWLRMAFPGYIFVAMFFFVAYKMNTPERRERLWKLILIFASLASFLDFLTVVRFGVIGTFEHRAAGTHTFTLIALMMLFPALGTVLAKKKWLLFFFAANMFLLFLSGSRGVYLIILMGILYTLTFIQKRFSYRLFFSLFVIMVVTILIITPAIYERMSVKFEAAAAGEDPSTNRRLDETKDAIAEANKTWATLVFGKGFGTVWKSRNGELPGGYSAENPHNDFATRLLYGGLVGLAVQLSLYFVIGFKLFLALRRAKKKEIDIYMKMRLHAGLLVLITMVMQGLVGAVFFSLNSNVYEAFIIGMAMADATVILSGQATQIQEQ